MEDAITEEEQSQTRENDLDVLASVAEVVEQLVIDTVKIKSVENQNSSETFNVVLDHNDNGKFDEPEGTAKIVDVHQNESVRDQNDVYYHGHREENGVVVENAAESATAEIPSNSRIEAVEIRPRPSASTSSTMGHSFDSIFDDFIQKYLVTEPSKLDDREIRAFTLQIPADYVVSEDRYSIIFKVLFKIKDLQRKAVYNDSLALMEKVYCNLDYNKFLLEFWSCDQFKDLKLGPVGYSFSGGRHRYDFSDVQRYDSDIALKNAKAAEIAWSMLLDVEATVDALLNDCIEEKSLHSFLSIMLRRFKCLGDYKLKISGKEIPIFLYFFEKAHDHAVDIGYLQIILSYLVSVTWTPKSGKHRWSLMKPNYSLCKIMEYILREDENQPKYFIALQRLFNPFEFKLEYFECDIEWDSGSEDFDNPSLFLSHFIKYFNRKNSIGVNNDVFYIVDCFKKSMHHAKAEITNFEMLEENAEIDWPFAYCILDLLEVRNVKRRISESIFEASTFGDKCISMNEREPSLKTALIGIMELYFICRSSRPIPDAFFKNLFVFYGYPKSVIDVLANAIFEAYKNLKKTIEFKIDIKFIDFLSRICEISLDSKVFEQFSSMVEMDTDLIHQSIHLVIAGRVLRMMADDKFLKDNKKPSFPYLGAFFNDLFNAFSIKVRNKFGEIFTMNQNLWPPWRKGTSPSISDEKSMAINHVLNAIQKEAFCIFDIVYGRKDEVIDLLFYLYKERRYFGFTFSKLDTELRSTFPSYFEELEASLAQKTQQKSIRNNSSSENRQPYQQYSQTQHIRQQHYEHHQQTYYPSSSSRTQSNVYSGNNFDDRDNRGRGNGDGFGTHPMQQRNNGSIGDGRPSNRSGDGGSQSSRRNY
uniref:Uncharacterized protein n=1 Tax=Panagrolaimus sp. ES5 TaxID=591445 RepID=A0AC34GYM0_9BILA